MAAFDVIVVGLGAMGSAATHHLALQGASVLGLDQFDPPHHLGSSHGDTRITRLAVAEGDAYVPLVRRSHELWRALESATGKTLLVECGGLIMGVPNSTGQHGIDHFAVATREIGVTHGIDQEVLTAQEIRERFSVFNVNSEVGYFEPTAGYLIADSCIAAQLAEAQRLGAALKTGERVLHWTSNGSSVIVETTKSHYEAGGLVLAAGPWIAELAPELSAMFSVQRQVQYWFDTDGGVDRIARLPVFIWMHGTEAGAYVYGFPARDGPSGGIKVATEVFGDATSPGNVNRTVSDEEASAMYVGHIEGRLSGVTEKCLRAEVCLYTVTADFGFVIDVHTEYANVVVASPCSGHGFKHSAAVGECVAAIALGAPSQIQLSAFSLRRFA